jgi:hypothetical protein
LNIAICLAEKALYAFKHSYPAVYGPD